MKRVFLLAAVGTGLWLVLLAPAWWWLGEIAVLQSGIALAICLLPALATMLWANHAWEHSPDMQLLAALGGSGIRLGTTLGCGAVLYFQYPDTFTAAFWGWVILFYLVLLGLEIWLILRPSTGVSSDQSKASC